MLGKKDNSGFGTKITVNIIKINLISALILTMFMFEWDIESKLQMVCDVWNEMMCNGSSQKEKKLEIYKIMWCLEGNSGVRRF